MTRNQINTWNIDLHDFPTTILEQDVDVGWVTLTVSATTWFTAISTAATYYYLLIGNYGTKTSEIVLASAKTDTTFTVSACKYSHSASDHVTYIPYNQVKFYGRVTSGGANNLLWTVNIDCSKQFTSYEYTWSDYYYFVSTFYRSDTTAEESWESDEISFTSFTTNSVKKIIEAGLRKAMTRVDENPNGLLSWSVLIDLVNEGLSEILTRKKKWQCLHKRIAGDNTVADTEYISKPSDLSVLEFLLVNDIKLDYITKYQYNQITQNGTSVSAGAPSQYTIKNDKIYMVPKPSSALETIFEYYSTPAVVDWLTDEVKKEFATILVYFVAAQAAYIRNNEKRGNLMESKYVRVLENQIEDVTWEEQSWDAVQTERFNIFDIE